MSLPSQEVLDDIKDLITEITGFREGDENFGICQRYCLSHVVHHSYPFINRTTVKNLVNSYVSRLFGHGYFRISQELNHQVKRFLGNEKLFEKNPQYDIQWSLLSLLSSLSSNLTSVKQLPELLPIDDEEKETEEIDWKEFLTKDLPKWGSEPLSSDTEEYSSCNEDGGEENKSQEEASSSKTENYKSDKDVQIIFDNKISFNNKALSDERRKIIEEFLKTNKSKVKLENDHVIRGNITEKFNALMSTEGIIRKTQLLSEYEMMEYVLYQFHTGERIFLRKGLSHPALTSVTQDTLSSFLESLQPYFNIIRSFKDFDDDITEVMYPEKLQEESFQLARESQSASLSARKKRFSNVLYIYNVMLRKALEPFQNEVTEIMSDLENYTLVKMERKLRSHFSCLASLFQLHNLATKNWKKDHNWMTSIRILSVLHNAVMNATTTNMSFLYLNFFLQCFQVYLDIIDSWISSLDLTDPNDEFIVAKSPRQVDSPESSWSEYETRPYKLETGVKEVSVVDFIAEKMTHVGQSLEVLKRLNRFVAPREKSSYQLLLSGINEKIKTLGKFTVREEPKREKKKRGIFTIALGMGLERDDGGGDCFIMDLLLEEMKKEEEEKTKKTEVVEPEVEELDKSYREFIQPMVGNPFYKMAFDVVGMKEVQRKLEEAKKARTEDDGQEGLVVVKKPEEDKVGVYPFQKIISETFHTILEDRVSDASALVKKIVLEECELPSHLSLLRSILLFNNSYLIQSFILAFFTQPIIWRNSYSLTLHLKECVKGLYKDQASCLSVTSSQNFTAQCENVLELIDLLTVSYEVKWPLTLIFTPDVMKKYNEIFRVALKLKWAHWALSGLHFPNDRKEEDKSTSACRHRTQLLRFWLLSALGRITNYFMAQMIPPELDLSSCSDLKDIIHDHLEFIDGVHERCLLGEKALEGRKLILDYLIPLCMELWLEGGDRMETQKVAAMEEKFASCHLQLSRLMSSLEK